MKVELYPRCFVRGQEKEVPITTALGGSALDTNVRNCGEIVSYDAYLTNNTMATARRIAIYLDCPQP